MESLRQLPDREIVLLDGERRAVQNYFVPFFPELECLTEKSEYTNWNYDLKYIELDESRLRDKAVFTLKGHQKQNTMIRLDVVESLLRRGDRSVSVKRSGG